MRGEGGRGEEEEEEGRREGGRGITPLLHCGRSQSTGPLSILSKVVGKKP